MSKHHDSPVSSETIFKGTVDRITIFTDERLRRTRSYTRESPLRALGRAAVIGYLLRVLPVRALIGALVDLTLVLMRPAAMLFGAAKVYKFTVRNLTNCCARESIFQKGKAEKTKERLCC